MPIESFYEMMEIDTDEKVENLIKAFEAAERRGPYVPKHDIMKELEEGRKNLDSIIEGIKLARERSNSQ